MNIFPNLKNGKWINVNLSIESKKANVDLVDPKFCETWIANFLQSKNADYFFGGFLEDRTYLWRNHSNSSGASLIHLGIDYSVPQGTKVSLPLDGKVFHIMKDPKNNLGWGGRVIWKLPNGLYLLYGHLKQDFKLKLEQSCKSGEIVGEIAGSNENGNWWPHLHVQIMNQNFIDNYLSNLNSIDGYLPKGDKNLKNIINPQSIVK